MNNPDTGALLPVTAEDRKSAASVYQRFRDHDYAGWILAGTNAGGDADFVLQAFARHRHQSETGAALTSDGREALRRADNLIRSIQQTPGGQWVVVSDDDEKLVCETDAFVSKALAALSQLVEAGEDGTSEQSWLSDLRRWAYPNDADRRETAALKKAARVITQMHNEKAWCSGDVKETLAMIRAALGHRP